MCDCDEKPKPTPVAVQLRELDRECSRLAERIRELEYSRWNIGRDLRRAAIIIAGGAALYLSAIGLHAVLYR